MADQLKEIGKRLEEIREVRGLMPDKMARKLGITEEEYLTYEKGEKDFSFSFLTNVSSILEIDVLNLLTGHSPRITGCAIVRKDQGVNVKKNANYEYKPLAYTFKNKKTDPLLVTITPSDDEIELHSHEGQEFNYVVEGKMKFYFDELIYELEAGDSVYFDSSVPHTELPMDNKPVKFIAIPIK